jgi:hypothetical protein
VWAGWLTRTSVYAQKKKRREREKVGSRKNGLWERKREEREGEQKLTKIQRDDRPNPWQKAES